MTTLTDDELRDLDAWWRAANYVSVGQIYLLDNPLVRRPLVREDIKPRLLGHWGTTPGLNLLWTHLNRLIRERDVDAIFLAGPGHGGPAAVANAWLEGTYSEVYPHVGDDEAGMRALFRQFSFPGGIPSHVAPETPGSIHEGGELGYVLSHAYGAAMDNPDLLVAAVVGDGEFETGPLATSWHANKFVDPVADGAVLPILHLNGYKIANPTIPARIPREELESLLRGYGHEVLTVEGDDPADVHRQLADGARPGPRHDPRDPAGRPRGRRHRAAAVADDPAGHPEGLDRAARGRRHAGRGHLAGPPGAAGRHPRERRAPRPARGVAAVLPARGAVRRRRPAGRAAARARAGRDPADERQPARQRRAAPPSRSGCPTSATTRSTFESPGATVHEADPRCSASTWSTWCATTRTTSGSSARTRPRPTGSTPSTR